VARNRRRISNSARFRVLVRRRQLLADDAPVELGRRAFDVLMVLLEADGAFVRKEGLISRVWPSIVVLEENLSFRSTHCAKRSVQTLTEFCRGYRFTGVLRTNFVLELCRQCG